MVKGEENAGGNYTRHKDNKKRKYQVSPHLLGVSVCVWWDGVTPLNPENIIVINCLLFCLQKVNTV